MAEGIAPAVSTLGASAKPSFRLLAAASLACLAFIACNPSALAELSVYGGKALSVRTGVSQLLVAAGESSAKVALAMAISIFVAGILLTASARWSRGSSLVRGTSAMLANAPVMMLLPLWLVVLGNSEQAGLAFLIYCISVMLCFTVLTDPDGAPLCKRILEAASLNHLRRVAVSFEIVMATMKESIFQTLLLGLPLALAAELITNRSGLGHIATTAFGNGNFAQLSLVAAAYIVSFSVLWSFWSLLTSLFFMLFTCNFKMG